MPDFLHELLSSSVPDCAASTLNQRAISPAMGQLFKIHSPCFRFLHRSRVLWTCKPPGAVAAVVTVRRWTLASPKLSMLCCCTLDSLLLQHTEKKGKATERLRQIFQVVSVNKYNYKKVFRVMESSRTSMYGGNVYSI